MCTLRLETPIIATANPAPSDVDKCGDFHLVQIILHSPCQITSLEIELGKIADVFNKKIVRV